MEIRQARSRGGRQYINKLVAGKTLSLGYVRPGPTGFRAILQDADRRMFDVTLSDQEMYDWLGSMPASVSIERLGPEDAATWLRLTKRLLGGGNG